MRTIVAALLTLVSTAALAQKEPLRPAPVSPLSQGTVAPADRAGQSNSADNAAPFAAAPAAPVGQNTPAVTTAPEKDAAPTPNLSR